MKHLSSYRKNAAIATLAALYLATLSSASPAVAQAPTEWDGLTLVPSKRGEFVYVRQGASLAGYKRVRLDPVEVAFHKNWDPNRGTQSPSRKLSKANIESNAVISSQRR